MHSSRDESRGLPILPPVVRFRDPDQQVSSSGPGLRIGVTQHPTQPGNLGADRVIPGPRRQPGVLARFRRVNGLG